MIDAKALEDFLAGKSFQSLMLYHHFIKEFEQIGDVASHPAKTMIGIATTKRRIAWVTAFGKNFLHVVFPFAEQYDDNL